MKYLLRGVSVFLVLCAVTAANAQTTNYFYNVADSPNSEGEDEVKIDWASALRVEYQEVTNLGGQEGIAFTFSWDETALKNIIDNLGPTSGVTYDNFAGTISSVYVMDGLLDGSTVAITGDGTDFKYTDQGNGFNPLNVVGFTPTFSLDADQTNTPSGVQKDEALTVTFLPLAYGTTYEDVVYALNNWAYNQDTGLWEPAFEDDPLTENVDEGATIRLGLHVRALPGLDEGGNWGISEASDKFLNYPGGVTEPPGGGGNDPVPEPATATIWGLGLLACGWARRRRLHKAAA